jgi:hypothetical protein
MQDNTIFKLINIDVDFKSSNNFLPQVDQRLFGSLNATKNGIMPRSTIFFHSFSESISKTFCFFVKIYFNFDFISNVADF